jgi:hypothetical protein
LKAVELFWPKTLAVEEVPGFVVNIVEEFDELLSFAVVPWPNMELPAFVPKIDVEVLLSDATPVL